MKDGFIAVEPQPMSVLRADAIIAGIAALCAGILFLLSGASSFSPAYENKLALLCFEMLVPLLLTIRRTHPVMFAYLAAVVAGASQSAGQYFDIVSDLVALAGVYSVAAFAPHKLRFLGFTSAPFALWMIWHIVWFGGALPGQPGQETRAGLWEMLPVMGLVLVAYLAAFGLGLARRGRLEVAARERERQRMLEQDAMRLTELAVADERARISREMHDIIAHSLASIVTLAEGGRFAARGNAELSAELFDKVAATGRDALTDVKRLLRAVDEPQQQTPAHGPADIAELVERARLAGQPISLEVIGEPRAVPAGLGLAIYRVAQESLTNVLKHAQGAATLLRCDWRDEQLIFHCDNELTGSSLLNGAAPSGRGLQGMRERVELFGGTFESAVVGKLFTVRAEWPLPEAAT
ncbi:sensor histidine kinase [Gulosibacter hominis]|uniref:sensor histidine kinase n=1 Tax=Gulosibacter hominis TaxID=2770504 RepID=UPI001919EC4B|nr:histidine kinase [Gulosibacter hominis]